MLFMVSKEFYFMHNYTIFNSKSSFLTNINQMNAFVKLKNSLFNVLISSWIRKINCAGFIYFCFDFVIDFLYVLIKLKYLVLALIW